MHQINILHVLIIISFISMLYPFPINAIFSINGDFTIKLFQEHEKSDSTIIDLKGDTKLVELDKTTVVPEIHDFHDILSAKISKINDDKLLFTIELAGDANKNEIYEAVYIWLLFQLDIGNSFDIGNDHDFSITDKQNKMYTLIIPNFGIDSKFEQDVGWYLAIFNNTNNSYTLPISKISNMPENKVEVFIDPILIGSPLNFNYIVSSLIRVNTTFLDKPPDYLIDVVPDSSESFWKHWFK